MDVDMQILESLLAEVAAAERTNPPAPPKAARKTLLISFDWGEGSSRGMLETLWEHGFHTQFSKRYPRTTIICRTAKTVKNDTVLDVVAAQLMDQGSATVVRLGGNRIYIWPDKPWANEKTKRWGVCNA
jgi:hypothetical protein